MDWPPGITLRPLTEPGRTPDGKRERSQFSASWSATLTGLRTELRMLRARQPILEVDIPQAEFRIGGMPRANARQRTPAIALSFETRQGAMRYAVDRFWTWQDNVRAIVLGLEALRRVDRYGISHGGQQYRGWLAIANTAEDPREVLRRHAGANGDSLTPHVDLTDPAMLKALRLRALRRVHPDAEGAGNLEAYRQVQEAWRSLEASGAV